MNILTGHCSTTVPVNRKTEYGLHGKAMKTAAFGCMILIALCVSCNKEKEPEKEPENGLPTLPKTIAVDDVTVSYTYDDRYRIQTVSLSDGDGTEVACSFDYDASGNPVRMKTSGDEEDMDISFTYEGANVTVDHGDGDVVMLETDAGNIVMRHRLVPPEDTRFIYENGNIVKEERRENSVLISESVIEYDDGKHPFSECGMPNWAVDLVTEAEWITTRNNPLRKTWQTVAAIDYNGDETVDENDRLSSVTTYEYTYNDDEYPTEIRITTVSTFCGETEEYETIYAITYY
ncbi:MAG: hypothetical protein LBR08_12265 [Bacteroidales bacterium]|jgi:hypothetical protein|nr:hypothetical protein [Bacteroidales bacterium]